MITLNDSLDTSNLEDNSDFKNLGINQDIRGNLCFHEINHHDQFIIEKFNVSQANSFESLDHISLDHQKISFNIDYAKIIKQNKEKFVVYTIILNRPNFPEIKGSIERRYTDFCFLHASLKKSNFITINEIFLPQRFLLGNFQYDTIYHRSRAFETYLHQLTKVTEIFNSPGFIHFFMGPEKELALRLIVTSDYNNALIVLKNVLNIQRLIQDPNTSKLIYTMALLSLAYRAIKSYQLCWDTLISSLNAILSVLLRAHIRSNVYTPSKASTPSFDLLINNLQTFIQVSYTIAISKNMEKSKEYCDALKLIFPISKIAIDMAWKLGRQEDKTVLQSLIERLENLIDLPKGNDIDSWKKINTIKNDDKNVTKIIEIINESYLT